jgi:hypothetical protein
MGNLPDIISTHLENPNHQLMSQSFSENSSPAAEKKFNIPEEAEVFIFPHHLPKLGCGFSTSWHRAIPSIMCQQHFA